MSAKIEVAELLKKDGLVYEVAEKITYDLKLNTEEKEVAETLDAWAREIGNTGKDSNQEIAEYIRKTVVENYYNAPDELIDTIFTRGEVGEFDDIYYDVEPKNTLVAHEAGLGGTVDASFIDSRQLKPTWKNRQISTEITYRDMRKNGFKSVANLTTFANESLKNAMFYDIFNALDSAIVSGDAKITVGANAPTLEAMKKFARFLKDRNTNGSVAVGLSKYIDEIAYINGYNQYMSEAMKNEFNKYGMLNTFNGVKLASVPTANKQANGNLLLPDMRIFGCAGKIGNVDMKGDMRVYQDMNNNNEKISIQFKNFTYGYAITNIDNVCKMEFTA